MYEVEPFPPFVDPDHLPRVLSWSEALDRGTSRHAIKRHVAAGRWQRVLPRTYLTAATMTERDRVDAALIFAGDGAALSGAAALWASQVRRIAMPESVLVLVPPANRTRSGGWVRVRNTARPIDVEHWIGPRRTGPARATADLALDLHRIDDVRAVVARVVGDEHCSLEELAAELEAGPRRGSALLRQALTEVGSGAASAPEARAARILRRSGVSPFEQNARIALPGGGFYVADFLWRELRAILEIDSQEYHLGPAQWRATMDRHLALSTIGYSLVHRPPSSLRDEARFGREIVAWLASVANVRAGR